jgi:hypothetical protein
MVKIEIYQKSSHPSLDDLHRHDLIGSTEFSLTSLLKSSNRILTKNLNSLPSATSSSNPDGCGGVMVRGSCVNETRDLLSVQFSARNLPKVSGFFSTCDPFLTISRPLSDSLALQRVWKNSPIKFTNHPLWPITGIPLQPLCNGDLDIPLRLELFDWNSNGQHVSIGFYETSLRHLLTKSEWELPLTNSLSVDGAPLLLLTNLSLSRQPTFLQFLKGGCNITVSIGIDFTQANGEPSDPSSHHHWDSSHVTLNSYERAISSVGSILEEYDDDKMFPVYGFGAKVRDPVTKEYSPTQHWFPLSESGEEVQGTSGVLDLYRQSMRSLQFDQPLLLKPLLDHVVHRCSHTEGPFACTQEKQKYTILLLLTCGGIADFEASIDSIVHAAQVAPLSIIIVGIGESNFAGASPSTPLITHSPWTEMHVLDGDVHALQSGEVVACRDIVQFVR